ncbi:MAG: hypothetical protein NTX25_17365 [Proteobacteria bacterium]|nr:hypothetical protein [Pseudomonadota bacterium]
MNRMKKTRKLAVIFSSTFIFTFSYVSPTHAAPECFSEYSNLCIGQAIDGGGGVGGSLCAGRYCVAFKRVPIR